MLALTITLGCWSEVEYKEPEKTEVEQPEADTTVTAPTETEPSTTNEQPTTENESSPVADSTPTVEAEPPTEPPASPPTESLTFEEWLSTADAPADNSPSSDEPSAAEAPTQPPSTPSVGERYAPTTPPALTEAPVASEPESPVVGDHYAPTSPASEETTPTPAAESPTTSTESTRTPLPWELPEETPETETPETETSEPTTPDSTESIEEPIAEIAPSEESPTPIEESPPMEPAPMTEPAMEEPSVPESSTIVLSPAEPESPPEVVPLPPLDPQNSRNLAWLLGSKWSLWLLSEHAGAPASERDKFSQESETVAKAIGIELPSTPPYAASKPTAAFLESVLPLGRELGASIGKKLGPEEMALFEASTKSNLLLVLGDSRPDLIPAVVRAVTDAANRANLPDELLQPFTTALSGSPTTEQVDRAVYDFHRTVEESLRAPSDKP